MLSSIFINYSQNTTSISQSWRHLTEEVQVSPEGPIKCLQGHLKLPDVKMHQITKHFSINTLSEGQYQSERRLRLSPFDQYVFLLISSAARMASVNQLGPVDKNDRLLMCLFAFNDLNDQSQSMHPHIFHLFSVILRSVPLLHVPLCTLFYSVLHFPPPSPPYFCCLTEQ